MLLKKILVPTDFSDGSDAALAMACSLARDNDAKLLIVHVHEPNVLYGEAVGAAYSRLPEEHRADSEKLLESVKPTDPGIEAERRLVTGTPADAIVEMAASEEDVDLIVLGTHGRTGLTRLLMGSVAEQVVRKATCPVLTVKEPSEEKVETSSS